MKNTEKTSGFSIVEIIIVVVIVSTLFVGIAQSFQSLSNTYALTRQLNEMYAVLSSCPEIDRALQFESISGATNCFPNNIFQGEGLSRGTITYTPTLTVQNTTDLATSDPLYNVYDSKVIDISVNRPGSSSLPWKIRLMVTRNGIGQQ